MERRLIDTGSGRVAVSHHAPAAEIPGLPLLAALHGGTYTSAYFGVAGGPSGSFLDIAGRNGFSVLTVDRPGYGESTLLPEEERTPSPVRPRSWTTSSLRHSIGGRRRASFWSVTPSGA